jgi:diguanylate cyclase (GGDEF)-like protein
MKISSLREATSKSVGQFVGFCLYLFGTIFIGIFPDKAREALGDGIMAIYNYFSVWEWVLVGVLIFLAFFVFNIISVSKNRNSENKEIPIGNTPDEPPTHNEKALHIKLGIDRVDEYAMVTILAHLSHNYDSISVVYCDIDGMLGINQVYGTEIGDEVIRQVAEILLKCAGGNNISRFRGDQFVIVITEKDYSEAMKIAKKCRTLIKNHSWSAIAIDLYISCTFSVTKLQPKESASRCLLRLVLGVKEAKKKGKDRVVEAPLALPKKYDKSSEDHHYVPHIMSGSS